jgi:hypothetical protein
MATIQLPGSIHRPSLHSLLLRDAVGDREVGGRGPLSCSFRNHTDLCSRNEYLNSKAGRAEFGDEE